MKLPAKRVEAFLDHPEPGIRAVIVYGPDAGLVKERTERLVRAVAIDPKDPFRVAELAASRLKDDPALLADEVAALCLTGGRRVVRVIDAGDSIAALLQSCLTHTAGDALIVIDAGELSPRSALRKLAEDAENAVALPCYADEGGGLAALIGEVLGKSGLTVEPDAQAWLADHLGGDRLLTRSELEKLALYMGDNRRVGIEDAIACVGDSRALAMEDLALAVADGHHADAQRVLDRLFLEGAAPVAVLRAVQRHFLRLHWAAAAMAGGKSAEAALAGLKPPVHFRVATRFAAQLRRWPAERLATALDTLLTAEADCKTTGMPARELCGRAMLQLTRVARIK